MKTKTRFVIWRAVSPCAVVLAGGLIVGCGGNGGTLTTNEDPSSMDGDRSASSRRGIQSLYFGAFSATAALRIVSALGQAGPNRTIELAYAPQFSSNRYGNAICFLTGLPGRSLSLVIDYGHHTMSGNAADLGKEFYTNIFKKYPTAARYRLAVANEDDYSNSDWSTRMSGLLKGLVDAWKKDNPKGTFPASQVLVRRIKATTFSLASSFSPGKGYPSFSTETEYHFPEGISDPKKLAKSGFTVVSNDGWAVNDVDQKEPKDLAYSLKNGAWKAIPSMTLSAFQSGWGGNSLLWHPAFHLWPKRNGHFYYDNPRTEVSGADLDSLCATIVRYVK
ncbi:hypothetical protein [Fimbriimonas ginsengisoli]|uniref:Lipoprotein n=1 Tax=Fimbriimonas ginsengisoli Gsoil 348 TaxID=661478 RepID=A0A068NZ73_FIMGI|nr:hypothetical protein [Fimbriimonas ginsengisoli]AIE88074.1 hypothetical protein OP10G_4706 [Fimbriimonas ginsengisoli Gsoil 348]